ncbi:hypothetical protein HYU17_01780 [Candidatus Woesearchaeota archaeon]|nr:hypothetical protein [Candidatus Woesearchaeota archaeon]
MVEFKGRRRKGQAALEYAMIATVVGVLLLPAIYLFLHSSKESLEGIDHSQLDKLGRDMVATAEKVYYMGPPSRILMEPRMPDNVLNISIQKLQNGINILLFNVTSSIARGVQTFAYDSPVSINGTFTAALENRSISAGLKEINIEAYEQPTAGGGVIPFAYINFGGRCPRSTTYDFNNDGEYQAAVDGSFFAQCYCDVAGSPKYRPSKTWQSGWFDLIAVGGNPFMVCANADYDADCDVDDQDASTFCTTTGLCGSCVCNPAPSCS